jgi:hypothetical protein
MVYNDGALSRRGSDATLGLNEIMALQFVQGGDMPSRVAVIHSDPDILGGVPVFFAHTSKMTMASLAMWHITRQLASLSRTRSA